MIEQETETKEKQYTAFGVTGGIGTMIDVFFALLLIKSGNIIMYYLPNIIESIKRLFGGYKPNRKYHEYLYTQTLKTAQVVLLRSH